MNTQGWIIIVVLAVANVTLIVSEIIRRRNKKRDVKELRRKKEAEMVERAGAESLETLSDDDLEDEIEPKQCHIWILGIVICLNIWILGAVSTHWWATTYFADNVPAQTVCYQASTESVAPTEVSDATTRGLFGDSFGAVNALVSAFAFAGMIVAFILQRYELRLQRKELQLTRDEMNKQTIQFTKQNKTLLRERFESTFFHMLELHQQNVNEISVENDHGRLAFYRFLDILRARYQAVVKTINEIKDDKNNNPSESAILSKWDEAAIKDFCMKYAYGHFFYGNEYHVSYLSDSESRSIEGLVSFKMSHNMSIPMGHGNLYTTEYFSSQLGHYYRHIYHIVRFVEHQGILNDNEKYQYVKMLRSQLSDDEQVLFYYNALSAMGEPWIRHKDGELPLIIKYKLIKNIPHFINYFYNDPRNQFADEIAQWRQLHNNKHFFEQLVQL